MKRPPVGYISLTAAQLDRISTLLKDENKPDERIQVLEKIAGGGYGFGQKYQALADLTGSYASRGDFKKALAAYIDLFPEWTMNRAVKALHDLASTVTEGNLPLFRQAVIEAVAAEPGRDANSQLIGISAEIATSLNKP